MGWCFGGFVGIEQFSWSILEKQYSQFPPVHDFWKPRWGVAYVPSVTNLRAIYAWVIRWHVTGMLSLAEHWHGRRALSNHVCAHSVISMWHVIFLQHLARACSEQFRSTSVLPINHVIQMPQCLSGFVNHDYSPNFQTSWSHWIMPMMYKKSSIWSGFETISKQKSLPPFVFSEAIRHICHFLIDKVFRKHFVSLSNHTYGTLKWAGFRGLIWEKLMFFLLKHRDHIQRR